MLRQNTSQAFKLAFLGVVFSLCSQNVLSDGVKQIEFLQKIGTDSDHYTVTAEWDSSGVCVDFVLPRSVQTVPGYENAQTMNIHYLETSFCSEMSAATQLFVVKSVEHTERVAQLWWEKNLVRIPVPVSMKTQIHMDYCGLIIPIATRLKSGSVLIASPGELKWFEIDGSNGVRYVDTKQAQAF